MSSILYYSNFCQHSQKIINILGKSKVSNELHFLCIDKRINKNGKIFLILENGQEVLLPSNVSKVPCLLLLNDTQRVIHGNEIIKYLNPVETAITQVATGNNMEPNSYTLGIDSGGLFGVSSDNYSFLDQTSDDLSAKGSGGTRQMYNYSSTSDNAFKIETPNDSYIPDKIGKVNMDDVQKDREMDVKMQQPRMDSQNII